MADRPSELQRAKKPETRANASSNSSKCSKKGRKSIRDQVERHSLDGKKQNH